jgi:hypothetical protein
MHRQWYRYLLVYHQVYQLHAATMISEPSRFIILYSSPTHIVQFKSILGGDNFSGSDVVEEWLPRVHKAFNDSNWPDKVNAAGFIEASESCSFYLFSFDPSFHSMALKHVTRCLKNLEIKAEMAVNLVIDPLQQLYTETVDMFDKLQRELFGHNNTISDAEWSKLCDDRTIDPKRQHMLSTLKLRLLHQFYCSCLRNTPAEVIDVHKNKWLFLTQNTGFDFNYIDYFSSKNEAFSAGCDLDLNPPVVYTAKIDYVKETIANHTTNIVTDLPQVSADDILLLGVSQNSRYYTKQCKKSTAYNSVFLRLEVW